MLTGLDVHYELGEGHPLLGRRMPDLELETRDGPTRVFMLLNDALGVLLNLGEPGPVEISAWSDRVHLVQGLLAVSCELPVVGEITSQRPS
jgi:3-(3-hydroxy-phenyl)propionate hydroxylase